MGQVQWLKPAILAFPEAEIRRTKVQGQPPKKLARPPFSTNKSWTWWFAHVILATQKCKQEDNDSGWHGHKHETLYKK
jgi:hypothetical protein